MFYEMLIISDTQLLRNRFCAYADHDVVHPFKLLYDHVDDAGFLIERPERIFSTTRSDEVHAFRAKK